MVVADAYIGPLGSSGGDLTVTGDLAVNGNATIVDYVNSATLQVGDTQVITSGRALQNLTADASLITNGTISTDRIPIVTPSMTNFTDQTNLKTTTSPTFGGLTTTALYRCQTTFHKLAKMTFYTTYLVS